MADNLGIGGNYCVAKQTIAVADVPGLLSKLNIAYRKRENSTVKESFTPNGGGFNFWTVFEKFKGYEVNLNAPDTAGEFVDYIGTEFTEASGEGYSPYQSFTAEAGRTDFILSGNSPADPELYEVWINGFTNNNGDNGFTFTLSSLVGGNRTLTVSPGPAEGNQNYKIRWKIE